MFKNKKYIMSLKTIQQILKRVEQPSRYIGTEINSIKKSDENIKLKIAMAFPDLYDIGTSHFGIQILYNILNQKEYIVAERVYAPAPDMEKELRSNNIPLFSLESQKSLNKFDIIGFSLLYELNYTNILTILDLSGIPFLSKDRGEDYPLIIAGGPSVFNPEPVADIFDVMIVGDGENVIIEVSDVCLKYKDETKLVKLKELSKIQGVYIPSFFDVTYKKIEDNLFQILTPVYDDYLKVNKAIISDLENAEFPEKPVIPFGKPIHDRLRLEISRGCSRGCRFCQAGMIYRPVRERKVDTLINITNSAVCHTGYEDISLLSLSTADYENLNFLMRRIMEINLNDNKMLSFSLPSVRAGKLNAELMETIKTIKKTGFTIAPEAGTQRLRDVINKGLTEEEIINTVENAFTLGWKNIKLYFMIGLPTETMDDLQGIVDIVKKLKEIKYSKGKKPNITVSVSTFVPKPHTPFQWESQITEEDSWEKILWLKDRLKLKGITLKWGKTNISYLEGIMSRGDRRLTPLIINAYNKGCRLDGWNEHLKLDLWKEALVEENIDVSFYSDRKRNIEEPLPWDLINTGIGKEFFIEELEKADKLVLSEDCRTGKCLQCGVCDFKEIKPQIEDKYKYVIEENAKNYIPELTYFKNKIKYSKTGKAKYFGHLELVNIFSNILRILKVPLKYSSGFNPKVKIVFNNPLPLGYESLDEFFIIQIEEFWKSDRFLDKMNRLLPEGLNVFDVKKFSNKLEAREKDINKFNITIKDYVFDNSKIDHFNKLESVLIEKVNKKGVSNSYNLKEFITFIEIIDTSELIIDIKKINGITIRPEIALDKIFSPESEILTIADIKKIKNFQ